MDASILLPFSVAIILALIITPIVKFVSHKTGFVSAPRDDRWHTTTTALLGGIAIYLSFIATLFLTVKINQFIIGAAVAATIIFFVGLWDDLRRIRALYKLLGQFLAAIVFVALSGYVDIFPVAFLNVLLAISWLVCLANAFNLLDNMDGLSAGVGAISCLGLGLVAYFIDEKTSMIVALIFAGSLLGYLKYNFHPAKIFMGDSGSMLIGLVIAALTIQIGWKSDSENNLLLLTPILFAAVPLFDTSFVTIMRLRHGRRISQGGKDHTSHRLAARQFSEKNVALILYAMAIAAGATGVVSLFVKAYLFLTILSLLFLFFLWLAYFLAKVDVYSGAAGAKN